MASDYIYTEQSVKESQKVSLGLKRLLIIIAIIVCAEIIWLFIIRPFIPFSSVEAVGFSGLESAEILRLAGISDTSSYASCNVNAIKAKISSHILVESAAVAKYFPDRLSIFAIPRTPAAQALTVINGKQTLIYVDRKGVFFKTKDTASEEDYGYNIPLICGIENPQVYMKLPDSLISLTETLSVLKDSSPELLASISEIRIERKTYEGYELVIFPVHTPIKVRVESNLTESVLRYMLLILGVFESSSEKPEEIDFRSGIGSYIIKEPAYE